VKICPYRLIDTHTHQLVSFDKDDTIPPYAILSHRWIEGEEVTLQEYSSNPILDETQKKSGFRKILKACTLAQKDNLNFLWVDTCCIDKENFEELSRDIQSMYAYYRNANVCYAYLLDVGQCASSGKHSQQAFFHRIGLSMGGPSRNCWHLGL